MFQNQADQDMYVNYVLSSKILSQKQCHTEAKFQPFVRLMEPDLQEHLSSEIHKNSCSAENVSKMSNVEKTTRTEIGMCISNQNAALCNRIGSLMIEVFNNCKRGTISAWSWPSIHISNTMSSEFDMGSPHVTYNPSPGIFSYVRPMQHADLLSYIVSGHKPEVLTKIKSALAVSLAIDGSVDRFQLDNKYVKCKIITSEGEQEDLFLGFRSQRKGKQRGMYLQSRKQYLLQLLGKICLTTLHVL